MRLLLLAATALFATAASAQTDPSNPAGVPVAPSAGPSTEPTQGQVIRDAAPGADLDAANQPKPPSVLNGVEESQRTASTKPLKGEPPVTSRDQAPVETGPAPHARHRP